MLYLNSPELTAGVAALVGAILTGVAAWIKSSKDRAPIHALDPAVRLLHAELTRLANSQERTAEGLDKLTDLIDRSLWFEATRDRKP